MSKLTHEEMDRIINEHFGYEAQDDFEGAASTLTEDAEHDIVGSPGSQIRRSYQPLSCRSYSCISLRVFGW